VIVIVVMIWFHARKIRGTGRAASPLIFRKLRERTKRPLEGDPPGRIIIYVFGADDLVRRSLIHHPVVESRNKIVRRIGGVRSVGGAAMICPNAFGPGPVLQ
jgi:hypothetical protein